MTQTLKRKRRPAGDEGAVYTSHVMAEVKRLRLAKTPLWTAEHLAAEMTAARVPWTRDTVVNLEIGRRKRLAAHELLTLAYVLEVDSPVDLLAPLPPGGRRVPATPNNLVMAEQLREWCERQTGPLRRLLGESTRLDARDHTPQEIADLIQEQVQAGTLTPEGIDDIVRFLKVWAERMEREAAGGDDGQD